MFAFFIVSVPTGSSKEESSVNKKAYAPMGSLQEATSINKK